MNGTTTKARAVAPVRILKFGNLIGRGFGFLGTYKKEHNDGTLRD
jgi:hypothetical protein